MEVMNEGGKPGKVAGQAAPQTTRGAKPGKRVEAANPQPSQEVPIGPANPGVGAYAEPQKAAEPINLNLPNIKSTDEQPVQTTRSLSAPEAARVSESAAKLKPADTKGLGLFRFGAMRVNAEGYGLQAGAFSDFKSLMEAADQLQQGGINDLMVHSFKVAEKEMFRLIIGPFPTKGGAESFQARLKPLGMDGVIIKVSDLK
ncbi:MAG: SPOR domain-containing protein [Bacteroidota bacterium]